jgi:hypothetical protein
MTIEYITEYGSPNNIDDLFERGLGIGQNTGFYSSVLAQDLGAMFAPRAQGQGIGFDTRFIALNGQDLRALFAAKGTVPPINWVGTCVLVDAPSYNARGFFYSSSGINYFGTRTTISGTPIPNSLMYNYVDGDTVMGYQSAGGSPATITMTLNGLSLVMPKSYEGGYRLAGDPFNISGQLNVTLNMSLSP